MNAIRRRLFAVEDSDPRHDRGVAKTAAVAH
jgi:hypothetical protein